MTSTAISDPVRLADLAAKANAQHEFCLASANTAIQHARDCGQALIEAKSLCRHGTWQQWLRDNFRGSARTARVCMRIARHWPEIEAKRQSSAVLSIDQALRLIADSSDSEEDDQPDPTVESQPRVPRSGRDPRPGPLPAPGNAFMGRASLGASVLIEPHADPNLFFVAVYGPETDSEGNGLVRYARRAVGRDFVYLQLEILDARLDYDSIEWEQLPWEPRSGVHRLREWPSSEMV